MAALGVVGVVEEAKIVSPVIHNIRVTKMLVDGGSSLNLLTAKVLSTLQIPLSRLQDTGVFQGVNRNVTRPLRKIALPVMFGDHRVRHR